MLNRNLVVISCSLVMLLSACALVPQYSTMKAELEESRIQKSRDEERLETLQNELTQAEKKLEHTQEFFQHIENIKAKFKKISRD